MFTSTRHTRAKLGALFAMTPFFAAGCSAEAPANGTTDDPTGEASQALEIECTGGCGGGGTVMCEYDGTQHSPGRSFPSRDGCNTCTCMQNGAVSCTQRSCGPQACCTYHGQPHAAGDRFPKGDGCNECVCLPNGTVVCGDECCTVCTYGGRTYTPGQTFPATDGCNTCGCMQDGSVACTEKACC